MKKFFFVFTIFTALGLNTISAQCDFDACPGDIDVDVFADACDDTNPEIENITGFPWDDSGSGTPLTEAEFLIVAPFDGAVNSDCDATDNTYNYVDGPITPTADCQGSAGAYAFFERTWQVFDASNVLVNTCFDVQTIFLLDREPPQINIDNSFFTSQDPTMFNITSNDCPIVLTWDEPILGTDITDNCSMDTEITVVSTHSPGDSFDGPTQVCYTFTDACGNSAPDLCFDIRLTCVTCNGGGQVFEDCASAPIYCDLDIVNAISSCTPAPDPNNPFLGDLCSGFGLNNPSYISFIAGQTDIQIRILPSNCTTVLDGGGNPASGIQAAVVDLCNAANCYDNGDGVNANTDPFTIEANGLTPGNVYQLVVDGFAGSQCEYEIDIVSAPVFLIPEPDNPQVTSLTQPCEVDPFNIDICPGTRLRFFPENLEGSEFYHCWDINDENGVNALNESGTCDIATGGSAFSCSSSYSTCGPLNLEFNSPGTYELCLVELDNGCSNIAPGNFCYTINVGDPQPIDFGSFDVCRENLIFWNAPDDPATGLEWGGTAGFEFMPGLNEATLELGCNCSYPQTLNLNVIELDFSQEFMFELCQEDLDSWEDPEFGLTYSEITNNQSGTEFPLLIEDGADTSDDEGNCDIEVKFFFEIYNITGQIVENAAGGCNSVLSFDFDALPDYMDESLAGPSWTGPDGSIVGLNSTQEVSAAGVYTLTLTYAVNGATCSFPFQYTYDPSGTTINPPTWVSNPASACSSMTQGLVYSVTPDPGASFNWMATNGTIQSGNGTESITVDVIDTSIPMTVSVSAMSNTCGSSTPIQQTLNVSELDIALAMLPEACLGVSSSISSSVIAGSPTTYNWSVTPDGTIAGAGNTPTIDVTWPSPGVKMITLTAVDATGCESEERMISVNVQEPLIAPTGICTVTNSNTVTVEWTDIVPGQTVVSSSMPGTQNGTSYTVDNLATDTDVVFTFVTSGADHPCGDSEPSMVTCTTTDCDVTPTIMINEEYEDFCLADNLPPVQIVAVEQGGTWSGNGVDANGMFDPSQAVAGPNVITYEYFDPTQNCPGTATLTLIAYEEPDPMFSVLSDVACVGQPITILYTEGTVTATNWDYGDGSSDQMNVLATQFDIVYSSPGQKIISLELSNGRCIDDFELPVTIVTGIPDPILNCTPTPSSVEITWDPIEGVTMYDIEVISPNGNMSTSQSTTSVLVDDLIANQEVTVTVIAIDPDGCTNSMASLPCIAQACPEYTVTIDPGQDGAAQCFTGNNVLVLSAIVTDQDGNVVDNPMGTWGPDGQEGLDVDSGEFTPPAPSPIPYTITYTYMDSDGCPEVGAIDIDIFDSPSSSFEFDVDDNMVCVDDELNIILDNQYSSSIDYNIMLNADGIILDESSYTLVDNEDDTFTIVFLDAPDADVEISLQTVAGGCTSTLTEKFVMVTAPLDFTIVDLGAVCYNVDSGDIELEAVDENGDLVDGTWTLDDGSALPGNIFSPVGPDSYTLTFTEANCGVQESIILDIVEKPNLQISVDMPTVCFGTLIPIEIITNVDANDVAHTGTNGTTLDPPINGIPPNQTIGTDLAPLPIGVYTYESIVDLDGDCDSDIVEWGVVVEGPPEMPVMNPCVQNLNSIEFSWTDVPCAALYQIQIIGTAAGEEFIQDYTETSILIEDLEQGDEIEITVSITKDDDCLCEFEDVLTQTCTANECEPNPITFGDELEIEYCLTEVPDSAFTLTAEAENPDPAGEYTFSSNDCDCIGADGVIDLTGLAPGDYSIDVNYTLGDCSNYEATTNFSIYSNPSAIIDVVDVECGDVQEGSLIITGQGTGPFEYVTDAQTLSEGENTLAAGTYNITIVDLGNGCETDTTVTIQNADGTTASLNVPSNVMVGEMQSFTYDLSVDADSVLWTIDGVDSLVDCSIGDCFNFDFTPDVAEVYEICAAAYYNGCTQAAICESMEAEEEVEFQIKGIYIPNIIDPNENANPINQNLDLYISGYDLMIQDMAIYDRWGNVVHRTEQLPIEGTHGDVLTLWNGEFDDGRDFVPGVYVYVIEILFLEEDGGSYTEFKTGSLTVIN